MEWPYAKNLAPDSTEYSEIGEQHPDPRRIGQEENFAVICTGKALDQLCECTLRAAMAIDETRDSGQIQVSESIGAAVGRLGRQPQIAPMAQGWEGGTTSRARAKNTHSAGNLHKAVCRQR